jgi:DNA adenine methylase
MLLRRVGNKARIAPKLLNYFPEHEIYIEPFFGAGGMFFNKPKAKYNYVNDLDSDVYNLYLVLRDNKQELIKQIELMPIHNDLFKHWVKNSETDPILKAVRFLLLSNISYLGMSNTIRYAAEMSKKVLLSNIENSYNFISDVLFNNLPAKDFLKAFAFRSIETKKTFIYNDPPYLGTGDNYSNSFKEQDFIELLEQLISMGVKFGISEFKNDLTLQIVKDYNLKVIDIADRQNLKNRNTEIFMINYEVQKQLF